MGFSFFLKMESSCRIFSTCGVTVTGHVLIFQKKVKHLFVVTRFSSVGSRSGILGFLNGFDTENPFVNKVAFAFCLKRLLFKTQMQLV
jgi:hypothetical protein